MEETGSLLRVLQGNSLGFVSMSGSNCLASLKGITEKTTLATNAAGHIYHEQVSLFIVSGWAEGP